MNIKKIAFSLLVSASLVACSAFDVAMAPTKLSNGLLTDNNGMTLYTFDRDIVGSGKSVCNGPCATNWPPLMADEADTGSGDYSVIARNDGKKQWALKGKPLYLWVNDKKPGDKSGDGVNGVWHIVKP